MNKAELNRKIQVLEIALEKLTKTHNDIVQEINGKVHCEECRKAKIAHAKKRKKDFNMLSAMLLGAIPQPDYSAEPHKLFEKELE